MARSLLVPILMFGFLANPSPVYAEDTCFATDLLEPIEIGKPLIPGQIVDGFYLADDSLRIQMIDEASMTWWTLFIEPDRGKDAPGRAEGLVVLYSTDPVDCAYVEATVGVVVERIEGWAQAHDRAPSECLAVRPSEQPKTLVRPGPPVGKHALEGARNLIPLFVPWFLLALVAAGLFSQRRNLARRCAETPATWWYGVGGACLVSGVTAVFLIPHAPLHTNHHGIFEVTVLADSLYGPSAQMYGPMNGEVLRSLYRPFAWFFGPGPHFVFALGCAVATVLPLAMGLWGKAFSRLSGFAFAESAGLLVAWFTATWPVALRLGPTESPHILAFLLVGLMAVALFELLERPNWGMWSILVGLCALALRIRIQPVLWVLLVYCLVLVGAKGRAPWRWAGSALLLSCLLSVDHLYDAYQSVALSEIVPARWEALLFAGDQSRNLLLQSQWTSPIGLGLTVLGLMGILGLRKPDVEGCTRRLNLVFACTLIIVAFVLMVGSTQISGYRSAQLRYQVIFGIWVWPLASLGFLFLVQWAGSHARILGMVVFLAYFTLLIPGWFQLSEPDLEMSEWDVMEASVDYLPPTAVLLLPAILGQTLHKFPTGLASARGHEVTLRSTPVHGKIPAGLFESDTYYFRTLWCSTVTETVPSCDALERSLNLEPVHVVSIRERHVRPPNYYRFDLRKDVRVGLYRVRDHRETTSR